MKNNINEDLFISNDIETILGSMSNKGNKIARLLSYNLHRYKTKSEINFLQLSDELNKISYYPSKNVDHRNVHTFYDYVGNITQAKIGRVIRKILSELINKEIKIDSTGCLYKEGNNLIISDKSQDFYLFSNNLPYIYYASNDGDDILNTIKLTVIDESKDIEFSITSKYDLYRTTNTLSLDIDNKNIEGVLKNSLYPIDGTNGASLRFKATKKIINALDNKLSLYDANTYRNIYHDGDKYISLFDNPNKVKYELSFIVNVEITDKDIEDFVNLYQSTISNSFNNDNAKLLVVKGEDISYWYNSENYASDLGQLGNSCMSSVDRKYFDIYVNNENVSMLIYVNKENKLLGRALIWKLDENSYNNSTYFMDRVYSIKDSFVNIFEDYAVENNYLYRESKTEFNFKYNRNIIHDNLKIDVLLKNYQFEYYPYIDTLRYLYDDILTNTRIYDEIGKSFNDTDGGYIDID